MDKEQLQVNVNESKPEPPKYDHQQAPPDPQPQKTEETTVYREEHHTSSSVFGWFLNATTKELKTRLSSIFVIAILCTVCLAVGSSFIFDESLNESAYNLGKAAWALMIIHSVVSWVFTYFFAYRWRRVALAVGFMWYFLAFLLIISIGIAGVVGFSTFISVIIVIEIVIGCGLAYVLEGFGYVVLRIGDYVNFQIGLREVETHTTVVTVATSAHESTNNQSGGAQNPTSGTAGPARPAQSGDHMV